MVLDVGTSLLYLLYEAAIAVSCLNILYVMSKRESIPRARIAVLLVALSIFISSMLASALSFLQANHAWIYLLAASVMAVTSSMAAARRGTSQYARFFTTLADSLFRGISSRRNLLLVLVMLPLLLNAIKVPGDTDSSDVLTWILPIAENRTNPYTFYYDYVAFWEMSYMPSMVITESAYFFWLVSLKPVVLIGLGAYLVGRTLGLPGHLPALLAFSGVLFVHLWLPEGPSGVTTLKNDMVFGAGTLLLAYYVIRSSARPGLADFVVFLLGSTFVLTKYSGVPIILLAVILVAISRRSLLPAGMFSPRVWVYAGMLLVSTGHYYIKNLVTLGNPFYPIAVVMGGILVFSGGYDLADTTILSSVDDPGLWDALVPESMLDVAILVPMYVGIAVITSAAAYAMARTVVGWWGGHAEDKRGHHLIAYVFVLGAWMLFVNTGWTASAYNNDLGYITSLNSLRYLEGLSALTVAFLVFLLWKAGVPYRVLGAFLAACATAQLIGMYARVPFGVFVNPMEFDYMLLVPLCAFVLFMAVAGGRIRSHRGMAVTTLAVTVAVFTLSPYLVDSNKDYWMRWSNDLVTDVHHLEAANMVLVYDPSNPFAKNFQTQFSGERFQHDVAVITEGQFHADHGKASFVRSGMYASPDYVIRLCYSGTDCSGDLDAFAKRMAQYGYLPRVSSPAGMVMEAGR